MDRRTSIAARHRLACRLVLRKAFRIALPVKLFRLVERRRDVDVRRLGHRQSPFPLALYSDGDEILARHGDPEFTAKPLVIFNEIARVVRPPPGFERSSNRLCRTEACNEQIPGSLPAGHPQCRRAGREFEIKGIPEQRANSLGAAPREG